MKKFLFISHITPERIRTPLRNDLFSLMKKSLYAQKYPHWKALWICENDETHDEKIKVIKINSKDDLKKIYLHKEIADYINDADFLIKLDDDDIILPDVLENAVKNNLNFDCYCDRHHTFYDIFSDTVSQQKRPWIAATCIHKREHAVKDNSMHECIAKNFLNSVFYGQHGRDWIEYYKNKNIMYASKYNPVYIRILSPTARTAGNAEHSDNLFGNHKFNAYQDYLKTFGAWNTIKIIEFESYRILYQDVWKRHTGLQPQKINGISPLKKWKEKVKNLIFP